MYHVRVVVILVLVVPVFVTVDQLVQMDLYIQLYLDVLSKHPNVVLVIHVPQYHGIHIVVQLVDVVLKFLVHPVDHVNHATHVDHLVNFILESIVKLS